MFRFCMHRPCQHARLLKTYDQSCFKFSSESNSKEPFDVRGFSGGCYIPIDEPKKLTPALCYVDQAYLSGSILGRINDFKLFTHTKDAELFYHTFEQKRFAIACSPFHSTGARSRTLYDQSSLDDRLRHCVGSGVQVLQERGVADIFVDPCHNAEAAAEGAYLAAFVYDELKSFSKQMVKPTLTCYTDYVDLSLPSYSTKESISAAWNRGRELAVAQNLARKWMEMPANLLSPMGFASEVSRLFEGLTVCEVRTHIRNSHWCHEHGMNGLLAVGAGSRHKSVFLEVIYEGDPSRYPKHVALIGKGVTFDAGGICIKPSAGMEDMRADMGGAAIVVATIFGLANLGVPINVRAYIPLCENMPGGGAMRPGDVIRMANGLTVQVNNTDAEGRLILADAMHIACKHPDLITGPSLIMDVATLTGAISVALGEDFVGIFCNRAYRSANVSSLWKVHEESPAQPSPQLSQPLASNAPFSPEEITEHEVEAGSAVIPAEPTFNGRSCDTLFDCLHLSATLRGERIWTMPMHYTNLLRDNTVADLVNVASGANARKGSCCVAAAFLSAFVPQSVPWIHFDIAGVMKSESRTAYMRKGMTGRPTRMLIEFLHRISQS